MLKRLLQVFATPTDQLESVSQDRIPLAAAVLLLEVAHSDGEFHQTEQDLLGTLLMEHFAVSETSLADLLELAKETRRESHDLHQFTREINKSFSQPEKEQIIEAVWQLVYADGRLDHYEEALMRQLGALIGLSHRQLIEAKLKVANS
ncbi:MAG: TerB family tellurite resistance protein [Thermodesulfobacteriota bacterium]|nr:TerB family tellurite resistance protein [Thermodesulfobacteriota bacterium]